MSTKVRPGVGEAMLPFDGGLPAAQLGVDWEQPISLRRLLDAVSGTEPNLQSMGSVTADDLTIIDPDEVKKGLYIGGTKTENAYNGLVLPAADYNVVVTSPTLFGNRVRSRTEVKRQNFSSTPATDFAKARDTVVALERKIPGLEGRRKVVADEAVVLASVQHELGQWGYAHFKAARLYDRVVEAKAVIGQMVDVAGKTLNWSVDDHKLAARALTVQLFGFHGDANRRAANWRRYNGDAIDYNHARGALLRTSQKRVEAEIAKYQQAAGRRV